MRDRGELRCDADPDQLAVTLLAAVLEYAVQGHLTLTGRPYENRFVSVITIQNRKVTHWRDYLDSYAVVQVLGTAVPR